MDQNGTLWGDTWPALVILPAIVAGTVGLYYCGVNPGIGLMISLVMASVAFGIFCVWRDSKNV